MLRKKSPRGCNKSAATRIIEEISIYPNTNPLRNAITMSKTEQPQGGVGFAVGHPAARKMRRMTISSPLLPPSQLGNVSQISKYNSVGDESSSISLPEQVRIGNFRGCVNSRAILQKNIYNFPSSPIYSLFLLKVSCESM